HLLTGLFTNLAVFTISVGIVALDFNDAIASEKMIYLLLFWVLGLIWGTLIYGLFSFIFYEANTAWDGAVFVVAHSFALQMFFTGLIMVLEWFKLPLEQGYRLYNSVQLSPYVPFQWTKDFFEEKINPPGNYFIPWNYDMSTSGMLFTLIFYLILGVASYIVFFRFSAKKRVEKTGDISDSLFGYRTLLPMGAFLLFVVGAKTLVITIVALACTLGGYAIYRRGFHLKRSDWTILICLTAFSLMLSV
ncbi:MAG: hypothetical protein IJC19_05925, partial [Clostridia bacterium]|nr:hypothetical protein [Clostridia bacterium]